MPKRTIEGDVLQIMSADLIAAIADQLDLALFGEVVSGAGFIPDQTVCGIISIGGITKFEKVSKIMSAVRSNITNLLTQDKVTEKFDAFVLLLRDSLRLDDIAKDLADALSAKKPGYTSPLIEGAVANPDVRSKQESAAQIPLARAIQSFSEEMTTEELQPWLLSTQMPQKDRKIFEENGIGGIVFLRSSEEDRKNLKISSVGLIVWNRLIEKISSPADVGQAVSTNDAVCASVDIDGSASAQSQEKETVGNKYPGHTLIKDHHYGCLCTQLRPIAANWEDIASPLGFKGSEIKNIKADPLKLLNAPGSYIAGMIERWSHWAPADARESKDYATLEALKKAVDIAGFDNIAKTLNLDT